MQNAFLTKAGGILNAQGEDHFADSRCFLRKTPPLKSSRAPLGSRRLFSLQKQAVASLCSAAPPFRKRSRLLRLLGCKRPRNASAALPIACGARLSRAALSRHCREHRTARSDAFVLGRSRQAFGKRRRSPSLLRLVCGPRAELREELHHLQHPFHIRLRGFRHGRRRRRRRGRSGNGNVQTVGKLIDE